MATKERHPPRAGQATAWPGPVKDPAWAGPAPEPAQAGRAQEPARAGRTAGPARTGWAGEPDRSSRAPGPAWADRAREPVWRARLEAQWRDRVQEVTELSLAYHEAAAAAGLAAAPASRQAERTVRRLLRRTVAARQALADTEEALGRLASGRYGLCEGCAAAVPARLLAAAPDTRYCPRCRPQPGRAAAVTAPPALSGG